MSSGCIGHPASLEQAHYAGCINQKSWSNSQTKKDRKARLQQVPDLFFLQKPTSIEGKHILLVDDVLTTGATLEAAIKTLMTGSPASVSIAVAAYTL